MLRSRINGSSSEIPIELKWDVVDCSERKKRALEHREITIHQMRNVIRGLTSQLEVLDAQIDEIFERERLSTYEKGMLTLLHKRKTVVTKKLESCRTKFQEFF